VSGDSAIASEPVRLSAGDFEAVFLPGRGMLGASLLWRGEEMLRRIEDLDAAAVKGSTAGIPLLHPWANRLGGLRYRAANRDVVLDAASRVLHFDDKGLPIHGIPWARLPWSVEGKASDRLAARLEWDRPEWLAVFPFPHRMEMEAALDPGGLTITTTLSAGGGSVPIAFGFHPYVGIPGAPRAAWRLELPAMRRLGLGARGIPDGFDSGFAAEDAPLGTRTLDDGFALLEPTASFAIQAANHRVTVSFLEGFTHAQVYAPAGQDLIALEPMTAPTNALASGRGLRLAAPDERFRAAFRIEVRG
jgi:aldose 1-epimerase